MPAPLNILFIQAQARFGADAAVHSHLMRALDRREFRVHLACTVGEDDTVPPALAEFSKLKDVELKRVRFAPTLVHRSGADILRALRAGAGFPSDFLELRRYARREKIAIVHGSDRPRSSLYTVALAKLAGARSVIHVHLKWSRDYGRVPSFAVDHADACFSISKYVTESIVATGKPRSQVHTILNGVDFTRWDPELDPSVVRREFGIAPGAPLLASVSRLFNWKGHRELLRALALVKDTVPDVRLLIVGTDFSPTPEGSYRAELQALAGELKILDRVVFTGERKDIPSIMAAMDVFALPSFEEPFGLVFIEAMAMRKPVVALDNGGTPEVVEHGKTGLLSPSGDIPALAANIARLLKDPALRASFGAAGRERALEHFSAERMARDAGDAYQAIAASR